MSHSTEVPIILGQPDYDLPVASPVELDGGLAVTGRDSLSYFWRFAGDQASLWAVEHGAIGRPLGTIHLGRSAPPELEARCALLREAQARMRRVQTAYVQLAETLLSMAGDGSAELQGRLHALRERLSDDLLMFTDPVDDSAHAELRPLPELLAIEDAPSSDRERLRPLALILLKQNAGLLGIDDPDAFLALASGGSGGAAPSGARGSAPL